MAYLTAARGLVVFRNELSTPEGSLIQADNINIDEPDVITPRRGFSDYHNPLEDLDDKVKQLMSYKGIILRHFSNTLQFENSVNQFVNFNGSISQLDDSIRIKYQESNGNLYFTSIDGVKKIAAKNVADINENSIVQSGVPAAIDVSAQTIVTEGGFLPPESKVAYKALFGYKDVNNNLLLGTASSRYTLTNTSKNIKLPERTKISLRALDTLTTTGIQDEDYILYSTKLENSGTDYLFWFNKTKDTPQETSIRVIVEATPNGVQDGDYILLDTKSLLKLFIWFKRTNTGVVPDVEEKIGRTVVEVDLTSIVLSTPSQVTDTPEPIKAAANILATKLAVYTPDMLVRIDNEYVIITDKSTGPVEISTTNNSTHININVNEGSSSLPSTHKPNTEETFKRVVHRVDIKDAASDEQAALILADVLYEKIPDIDVFTTSNTVEIINKNPGNVTDCSTNTVDGEILINIVQQGDVSSGQFCNAEVKISIPSGIDTRHFYQLYRSEIVTASDFNTLDEIDPSEEFNLVEEAPVSPDGITIPSIITTEDITPETFRKSNTALYTNSLTGQGILQSNDVPPIAKDLALFKNSMFYANTKGRNFFNLEILPGVDLLHGESIHITDETSSSTFNFIGSPRTYTLTFDEKVNTPEDLDIKLYSASNANKYVLWIDLEGQRTPPVSYLQEGYEVLRVNLEYANTAEEVKDAFLNVLFELSGQFKINTESANEVGFQNSENGTSNEPELITTNPLNAWNIDSDDGVGEDYIEKNVLVSSSDSPSLALDITARSLVRVINNDIDCPVTAQYVSSPDTVPGKILLKSKQTADTPFYIATSSSDSSVLDLFSTKLPKAYIPSQLNYNSVDTTLDIGVHDIQVNDKVIVVSYGTTYFKTITNSTANSITFLGEVANLNSINNPEVLVYKTTVESTNDEHPSRIYYSKIGQPEAVPIVNYLDIGSRDQVIKRIVALRDSLFVLKEDGIFVVSGSAAPNFSVRLLSSTSIIICPDSAQVLNNNLYFLSTQGVISVNESSDSIVSRQIENLIKDVTRNGFKYESAGFGLGYENDRAYILWLPTEEVDEIATQCYRYNVFERTWSRWTVAATCATVNRLDDTMYIGDGTRPYVQKERKIGNRTDFSDRNFTTSMSQQPISGNRIEIESTEGIEVGDTVTQNQYVTVQFFNRLLRKLTLDPNLEYNYNQLEAFHGDSMTVKVQQLIDALNLDGFNFLIVASVDYIELRDQLNDIIISELNSLNTQTSFKNYKPVQDLIEYEAIITSLNRYTNTIELNYNVPFVEGSLIIYKHIKCVIEWQPQHFGDPSQLKQVREASVMFDQNNFYKAKLSFATDLSQDFVDIPMPGRGVGYWGYGQWGTPDFYWGGRGNDSPFRTIVPREKQRCRYMSLKMEHTEARSYFRVVGVSSSIRPLSTRAYRK